MWLSPYLPASFKRYLDMNYGFFPDCIYRLKVNNGKNFHKHHSKENVHLKHFKYSFLPQHCVQPTITLNSASNTLLCSNNRLYTSNCDWLNWVQWPLKEMYCEISQCDSGNMRAAEVGYVVFVIIQATSSRHRTFRQSVQRSCFLFGRSRV
jgi:hypothetical protein